MLEHLSMTENYYDLDIDSEPQILLRLLKSILFRMIGEYYRAESELEDVLP